MYKNSYQKHQSGRKQKERNSNTHLAKRRALNEIHLADLVQMKHDNEPIYLPNFRLFRSMN